MKNNKVAAIVPSYNEEKRIDNVLKVLVKTKILDEIIVVDDGSKDNTKEVVKKYSKIKYLRNNINKGKSFSMKKGVNATNAGIIFFCDADLRNLTPKIVESIIKPVLEDKTDMFLGVRDNVLQKTLKKSAINTGERALRREIWDKVPDFYKHNFRIEIGLNSFVKRYGRGYDYKVFPYKQTTKEKKYGFFKGLKARLGMSFDELLAYIRAYLIDPFIKY